MLTQVSKPQAMAFYALLCKKYNGSETRTGQGIASEEHISETLDMPLSDVKRYCESMCRHNITERQGGGIVI